MIETVQYYWKRQHLIDRLKHDHRHGVETDESYYYGLRGYEDIQIGLLFEMEKKGLLVTLPRAERNTSDRPTETTIHLEALAARMERLTQLEAEIRKAKENTQREFMRTTITEITHLHTVAGNMPAANMPKATKKKAGSSMADRGSALGSISTATVMKTSKPGKIDFNLEQVKSQIDQMRTDNNNLRATLVSMTQGLETSSGEGAR
jgi:hypothetical protein